MHVVQVTFFEWAPGSFKLVAQAVHVIEDCVAPPHDFIFTDDYYVFMHYRFTLDMAPFLLGLKGPAECMVPATSTQTFSITLLPQGFRWLRQIHHIFIARAAPQGDVRIGI